MPTYALPQMPLARNSAVALILIILLGCFAWVLSQPRALPQLQALGIQAWCDAEQVRTLPASFSAAGCQSQATQPADPQGRLLLQAQASVAAGRNWSIAKAAQLIRNDVRPHRWVALQVDKYAWGLFWAGGGLQRCRELLEKEATAFF